MHGIICMIILSTSFVSDVLGVFRRFDPLGFGRLYSLQIQSWVVWLPMGGSIIHDRDDILLQNNFLLVKCQ